MSSHLKIAILSTFLASLIITIIGIARSRLDTQTIECRKPIKPILKITTDGVKSDTVYIYQKQ